MCKKSGWEVKSKSSVLIHYSTYTDISLACQFFLVLAGCWKVIRWVPVDWMHHFACGRYWARNGTDCTTCRCMFWPALHLHLTGSFCYLKHRHLCHLNFACHRVNNRNMFSTRSHCRDTGSNEAFYLVLWLRCSTTEHEATGSIGSCSDSVTGGKRKHLRVEISVCINDPWMV